MAGWEAYCSGFLKHNDSYINGLRKLSKGLSELLSPSVFPQECVIYAQNIAFQLNEYSQKIIDHS